MRAVEVFLPYWNSVQIIIVSLFLVLQFNGNPYSYSYMIKFQLRYLLLTSHGYKRIKSACHALNLSRIDTYFRPALASRILGDWFIPFGYVAQKAGIEPATDGKTPHCSTTELFLLMREAGFEPAMILPP